MMYSDNAVMSLPVKFSTFLWVSSKKAVCLENTKKKYGLAQFYELFQVLQKFSTKNTFSESNFLEVYAVVYYTSNIAYAYIFKRLKLFFD